MHSLSASTTLTDSDLVPCAICELHKPFDTLSECPECGFFCLACNCHCPHIPDEITHEHSDSEYEFARAILSADSLTTNGLGGQELATAVKEQYGNVVRRTEAALRARGEVAQE